MARDEQAVTEFVEQTAAAMTAAGFPRMPARALMALIAAESSGLTARELSERLGASPAAISGAVRYLQTVRMVHRVSQPGSRRDVYELPEHSWYTVSIGKNPLYDHIEALASKAVAAIDDPDSLASQRIQEMSDFFAFIQRRMPQLLEEWQAERGGGPARSSRAGVG
jgi:DNA-binding transcriptional regulator GbsR (MarR family)